MSKQPKLSDEKIIEAIVHDGQSDLYGQLYDRYSDKVFRKCIGFAKDSSIAQDMVQDIFLKVFFQLPKFQGKSKFSTWLYAITYNFCVEYYRKSSKYTHTDIDNQPEAVDDTKDEQELLQTQTALLARALEIIAPDDKAILLMKYQDDASIKDIETSLGISESAVKMRLARARSRAKEAIDSIENALN
ncbi:MAG: RNA polymerase sigma factor [Bacteroidia bacterium]